jgi:hypothetical protein
VTVARRYPGSAAAADSGALAVGSQAAAVVAEGGVDAAADLAAQRAVWVAAAADAAYAEEAGDASSSRGAHTTGDPHSIAPNSRRR